METIKWPNSTKHSPRELIPIPIYGLETIAFVLLAILALVLILSAPIILELKRPRDAGPRRIIDSDGQEIIGFGVFSAIFSNSNSRGVLLDDIEPQEFEPTARGSFSLSLPDIEI
jgi:hypothetical protein